MKFRKFIGGNNAALVPITTLAFLTSANGNNVTITMPGGIASGDVAVIFNRVYNSGSGGIPTYVQPSGFTYIDSRGGTVGSGGMRSAIHYKILNGTETTLTGMDGNSDDLWIVAVWRATVPVTGVTLSTLNQESTTGDPVAQTITTASAPSLPVLAVGSMSCADGAISPRTTSPAMSEIAGASTFHYAHYLIYNPGDTPSDISYDMDDEGSRNTLQSIYLTFSF